jgi:hypothetical protein
MYLMNDGLKRNSFSWLRDIAGTTRVDEVYEEGKQSILICSISA